MYLHATHKTGPTLIETIQPICFVVNHRFTFFVFTLRAKLDQGKRSLSLSSPSSFWTWKKESCINIPQLLSCEPVIPKSKPQMAVVRIEALLHMYQMTAIRLSIGTTREISTIIIIINNRTRVAWGIEGLHLKCTPSWIAIWNFLQTSIASVPACAP